MKKLTPNDPETRSIDGAAENIRRLKALFPELVTEGPNGAAVNVDVLKVLVGDATVTDADEKYALNWHGKRRARQLALTPSTGTLRPCPEDSVDWDTTQNLMIEGDNLEVLKLLQKSYAGKVKLIYIDPPYNTGKDFVYPDNFQDSIKNYLGLTGQIEGGAKISSNTESNGRFHTDWLNMMYPRLKAAHCLLAPSGLLFVSIDENEITRLRAVCDEILGEENFLSIITWRRKKESANDGKGFAVKGEFIIVYRRGEEGSPQRLPLSANYLDSSYNDPTHEYPEDRWRPVPIATTKGHQSGGYEYSVTTPAGTRIKRTWLYPEERFHELQSRGRIYWGKNGDGVPQRVMYAKESAGVLPDNLWIDIATNKEGKKEVTDLLGKDVFDTIKPTALIRHILTIGASSDSLVLDFFSGSGTTGHAIMAQNAADGGNRRYILVQLPEPLDPENKDQKVAADFCDKLGKPRNIAELTKERLRLAAKKIKDENPMFAGDLGFRVFKLDSSNIRAWEPDRDNLDQTLLDSMEHIKPDRTESDVLYELLLKLGLDLCVPIETRTFSGKEVHSVGGGVLMACLAPKIERAEVEALALGIVDWHKALAPAGDTTCVFRDSAFADDVAKTNMAAILEQCGIANVRSL